MFLGLELFGERIQTGAAMRKIRFSNFCCTRNHMAFALLALSAFMVSAASADVFVLYKQTRYTLTEFIRHTHITNLNNYGIHDGEFYAVFNSIKFHGVTKDLDDKRDVTSPFEFSSSIINNVLVPDQYPFHYENGQRVLTRDASQNNFYFPDTTYSPDRTAPWKKNKGPVQPLMVLDGTCYDEVYGLNVYSEKSLCDEGKYCSLGKDKMSCACQNMCSGYQHPETCECEMQRSVPWMLAMMSVVMGAAGLAHHFWP